MPPTQTEIMSPSSSSAPPHHSTSMKLNESQPSNYSSTPDCPDQDNDIVEKRQETVIVFDWDDTLLASSFLSGKGYRLDSDMSKCGVELDQGLRALEQSVCAVLNLACTYGEVHVITNAETGWVQLSAQKFIPAVVPLLSKLKIISARSTFECQFPESPLKWKYFAFQQKLEPLFLGANASIHKNIISFGDSHVEREAVRSVTRGVPNTLCKSVKFAERPSMEQLRRQIELVTNCFSYIHNHTGDLDLQLTVTVNDNTNSSSSSSSDNVPQAPPSSMPAHDDGCGNINPADDETVPTVPDIMMEEDDADDKLIETC